MSEELRDEITSINSIYGDQTLIHISQEAHIYTLTLPDLPQVSFRIEFSGDYPNVPPSILGTQSVGRDFAKGQGTVLVESLQNILSTVYVAGSPCLFDLIEDSSQMLHELGMGAISKDDQQQITQAHGQELTQELPLEDRSDSQQPLDSLDDRPPWILSDIVTEKKSVFVARAVAVDSVQHAKSYLAHLLATDKKVAKATHNITAWRIRAENGVQFQDCDDDGETAAGGRLLHLLELMNVWGAMVVVTRWYGGIQLGPDRFRIINQCARDAVVKGGFVAPEEVKDSGKKRGKR